MGDFLLSKIDDALVIHFQTDGKRINAYTLASTLVSIADAAKAANDVLNLGYDIEIVVEAVGPGSFRARIRAVYSKARNLFSDQRVQGIILSIIASFIYDRTLRADDRTKVTINTNEVLIERGTDRVIVPRHVYDATRIVEKNSAFINSVSRTIETVNDDKQITGIAFVDELNSPSPEVIILREDLQKVVLPTTEDSAELRIRTEQCDLTILKAILERSRRKWEFAWHGIRISAPITDNRFYDKFAAHNITIAPGDVLKVRLSIKESRDPTSGVYTNLSYEVTEFFEFLPAERQMSLNCGEHGGQP